MSCKYGLGKSDDSMERLGMALVAWEGNRDYQKQCIIKEKANSSTEFMLICNRDQVNFIDL